MHGKPRSRSSIFRDASWVEALEKHPWLYHSAYYLMIAAVIGAAVLLSLAEDALPYVLEKLLLAGCACVFGSLSIILSRPLAQSRSAHPWFVRLLIEGRSGIWDYGPWLYRLFGSGAIGFAFGQVVWLIVPNLTAAFIVGLVIGLGIWIWTWLAFSETGE